MVFFFFSFAKLVEKVQKDVKASHVLAPASTFGKNFMPRLASFLDVSPISDISAVKDKDVFIRPVYAGKNGFDRKKIERICF